MSRHLIAAMDNTSTALVAKSDSTATSKLLRSEKYSDLTIVCQGRGFKVHKAILCPQSEVISKLCDIDMLERKTGVIEHEEFDADTVERMIDFAYEKEYKVVRRPGYEPTHAVEDSITGVGSLAIEDAPTAGGITLQQDTADAPMPDDEEPTELSFTDKWVIHARVYGLADYYDMRELRAHAYRQFMHVAYDDELEEADLKGFEHVAREVGKMTIRDDGSVGDPFDSPLRSAFLSLVALHAPKLALEANFSALLCEPDMLEMFADIFNALGKRIGGLEEERDVNTSTLEAEKAALQNQVASAKADAESQIFVANSGRQMADQQLQHTEGVMQRLIKSLRGLPASCGSSTCGNEFGSLRLERNGNGDWQVRCGARKCRCKLN